MIVYSCLGALSAIHFGIASVALNDLSEWPVGNPQVIETEFIADPSRN